MKRLFYFCTVVLVSLLASCGSKIHQTDDRYMVYTETGKGRLYGLMCDDQVSLPPQFRKVEFVSDLGAYRVYPDASQYFYLFYPNGTEYLTNRRSGSKKIGFEPILLCSADRFDPGEDTYFNTMLADIGYERYTLPDDREILVFNYEYFTKVILGAAKEIVPGCSGYMYKTDSGQWGINALQIRMENYQGPKYRIEEQALFGGREFNQVIEVVKPAIAHYGYGNISYTREYIWFARSGERWESYRIFLPPVEDPTIEKVAVDYKLLNKALSYTLRKRCKGMAGDTWAPASKQRVGNENASIAFL